MAYKKQSKKYHVETPEERAWIEEKLNASKRWIKPYKGEIVYRRDGCSQEFVLRARYRTKEELLDAAKKTIEGMSHLDGGRAWHLVSAKLVGQAIDDGDDE